jgi:ATP-dependent Lon protease
VVVYPHMVIPLFVGREKSIQALDAGDARRQAILLVAQKQADVDDPKAEDLYRIGTLATILQLLKLPDGTVKVLVEGAQPRRAREARARASSSAPMSSSLADVEVRGARDRRAVALGRVAVRAVRQAEQEGAAGDADLAVGHRGCRPAGRHRRGAHVAEAREKQKVLEILRRARAPRAHAGLIEGEIDMLQIEKRIRGRVKQQMEKSQREYYLNEQMKAIQKELGEMEDAPNEVAELEKKIEKAGMPKEAKDKATAELNKLKMMSPMSAEATVVRNYIDWLVKVPWKKRTKVRTTSPAPRRCSTRTTTGWRRSRSASSSTWPCSSASKEAEGPDPLPRRPARRRQDLARPEHRARDQPQVRAHVARRRARRGRDPRPPPHLHRLDARQDRPEPGQGRHPNPLFLLDEIDKMSMDFRGDPSSALLEVLDPEQNATSTITTSRSTSTCRGDVRLHGQQPEHPGAAARPHGSDPSARLHRGREDETSRSATCCRSR